MPPVEGSRPDIFFWRICNRSVKKKFIITDLDECNCYQEVYKAGDRLGIYLDAVQPERSLDSAHSVVIRFIPGHKLYFTISFHT
jgi:hypothetical protein